MKVVIYGKPNCPWCVKAKDLAVAEGHEYTYIDIKAAGIDGTKLSEICGEPVSTVPQIFVDDKFIKGGFTGFNEHVEKEGYDFFIRERGEGEEWRQVDHARYVRSHAVYEMDSKRVRKAKAE